MASVIIPVTSDPYAELTVSLEEFNYTLVTRWNTRAEVWFLDLLDADGEALKSGIKVVVNWPLLGYRDTNASLPAGQLWAYDTSGHSLDPTLTDLGTRVLLVYEESA